MNIADVKDAYKIGVEQIKAGLSIGGLESENYFLLIPMSIVMGRNLKNPSEIPDFSQLQEFEHLYSKILYDTIIGSDVIELYPAYLGELTFMQRIQFSAERGDFKPQTFNKLDKSSHETVEEFLSNANFIYKNLAKRADKKAKR